MAKAIMVQGTMSNVGKSLLTAGLCRIFKQDGYKVAPFKSQNMALNSYITSEGLEMGRAQAMQAEAAGIAPTVLMNPILLKPTNDTGSQVIVHGEVLGNMAAKDYFQYKTQLIPEIQKSYEQLAAQYDIIVLEGAGSPAEINLNSQDIVNMGMAKLAQAPVILVGDIDRGGVFATLFGTLQLLAHDERQMIKAMVINKFRGDPALLWSGVEMIVQMTDVPVAGIVPYMTLDIDDEDSLAERLDDVSTAQLIDIVVIRLPHLSNFTDFNPLSRFPGVSLRYVDHGQKLGDPDLLILPGSKNTIADLLWLRQNGLEALILQQAAQGKLIWGICGGYQMLGETITDEEGLEHGGTIKGLGLLPVATTFATTKIRTQVSGTFAHLTGALATLSAVPFSGYEIHMGRTIPLRDDVLPLTMITNRTGQQVSEADGMQCGQIYGTYIHGIFDEEGVAAALIGALYSRKGLEAQAVAGITQQDYKEQQYDHLAEVLRAHLDLDLIYEILEAGL